jgi:hypothetical protein
MSSRAADHMFRSAIGTISADYQLSFTDSSAVLGGGSPQVLTKGFVYRFCATEACHLHFHAASGSASATTSKFLLPPLTVQYLTFDTDVYCAAIRNTTSGSLIVSKMTGGGLL